MNPKAIIFGLSIGIGLALKGLKLYNEWERTKYYHSLRNKENKYWDKNGTH